MRLVDTSGGRTELVELLGDHIAARDPEFLAHADALIADSLCAASPLITEVSGAAGWAQLGVRGVRLAVRRDGRVQVQITVE